MDLTAFSDAKIERPSGFEVSKFKNISALTCFVHSDFKR